MAYVDFAINDTGDLIFSSRNQSYTSCKIQFNISQTKVQRISFLTSESNTIYHKSDNYLQISFKIEDIEDKLTSVAYKDTDALIQLIAVQLKGTIGELPYRTTDGSKLSTYKHQNINDATLSSLESYLESFLKDYISNPSVTATPYIDYSNGYIQTVKLYIYSGSSLLLDYVLES